MTQLEQDLQRLVNLLETHFRNTSNNTGTGVQNFNAGSGLSVNDYVDQINRSANALRNMANEIVNYTTALNAKDRATQEYLTSISLLEREKRAEESRIGNTNNADADAYYRKLVDKINIVQKIEEEKLKYAEKEYENENKILEIEEKRKEAETKSYEYTLSQSEHQANLIQIQSDFYDVSTKEGKKHLEEQKKIWEIEEENHRKELAVTQKHNEAMAKVRKEELKGYTNSGKKKSSAEIHQLIGGLKKWNTENSFGRKAGDIASMVTNGVAGTGRTISSGKMDVGGMADKLSGALSKAGPWGAAAGGLVQVLKTAFELYSKVDKAASDYAKSVGGGKSAQDSMRISAAQLASELSKFGEKAYLAEDILKNMSEVSLSLGRNLEHISHIGLRDLGNLKDFGVDGSTIAQFDTFGVSVENVSKQIAELYGQSGKKGLNAQATIKAFTSNLKMAQNYTFARGQKALADMALKSAQLKFNLKDAEQFANKVSTLEGAMKAGASLSVLGGQFAMQGNPLAMLNEGLNDVESLQERMLAMTKGMAYWNSSKEQLEITAFDRERLKAMSEQTGIDYSELTSQAMNQARVERISRQLGPGINKDLAEYIKNIAELDEHGNAVVSFMGEDKKYSIDDLKKDPNAMEKLKKESESRELKKNATVGDIANDTRSIQDKLDDLIKVIQTKVVVGIMRIADWLTKDSYDGFSLGVNEGANNKIFRAMSKDMDRAHIVDNHNLWNQLGLNIKDMEAMEDDSYDKAKKVLADAFVEMQNKGFHYDEAKNKFVDENGNEYRAERHFGGDWIVGSRSGVDEIPMFGTRGEYVAKKNTMSDPFKARIIEGVDKGWIKPGDNTYGFKNFNQGGVVSNQTTQVGSGNRLGVEKANIDIKFSEPLKIQMGDITKVINENVLASILLQNQNFVQSIITKIGIMDTGFGYHKDNSNNPFPSQLYT